MLSAADCAAADGPGRVDHRPGRLGAHRGAAGRRLDDELEVVVDGIVGLADAAGIDAHREGAVVVAGPVTGIDRVGADTILASPGHERGRGPLQAGGRGRVAGGELIRGGGRRGGETTGGRRDDDGEHGGAQTKHAPLIGSRTALPACLRGVIEPNGTN